MHHVVSSVVSMMSRYAAYDTRIDGYHTDSTNTGAPMHAYDRAQLETTGDGDGQPSAAQIRAQRIIAAPAAAAAAARDTSTYQTRESRSSTCAATAADASSLLFIHPQVITNESYGWKSSITEGERQDDLQW